jgi:hypothetical protein
MEAIQSLAILAKALIVATIADNFRRFPIASAE